MSKIKYELPQMKYPEQKGLISVIVPIYNNETYLRECLDSIIAQTFTNWEAILVNDGSTDDTGKIIDEYAEKDPRFVAIHKQNEGTLLARKTGLENSKGEFIANIDHDDKYDPRFLEKMYAKIMETNADFVWCKCQVTDKKYGAYYVTDIEWSADASENIAMVLTPAQGVSWVTWGKLIRRGVYEKLTFPNTYVVLVEDPIQMVQIAYYSKSVAFIPEDLYYHSLTGFSSTPNHFLMAKGGIILTQILAKIFDGNIPCNVIGKCRFVIFDYLDISKKQRCDLVNELGQFLFLFKNIKMEAKLSLKICLFLAIRGIELPLLLRLKLKAWLKKIYIKLFCQKVIKNIRGGNSIAYPKAILKNVAFDIDGLDNKVVIEDGAMLNNVKFYIRGNNHTIRIGKDVRFNRGGSIWCEDNNTCLDIGEKTTIEDVHFALTEDNSTITVGRSCMLAYDIDVRTGDSHSILDIESNERINYAKNVNISSNVWIAAHCTILKGVEIREYSVVATNSVVTKVFDETNVILAGNPAKIVKSGIYWKRERERIVRERVEDRNILQ